MLTPEEQTELDEIQAMSKKAEQLANEGKGKEALALVIESTNRLKIHLRNQLNK